jgi:hypothetical protein
MNYSNVNNSACRQNKPAECIKQVLGFFEGLDLTGILSIISSFIYPVCRTFSGNNYKKKFKFRK